MKRYNLFGLLVILLGAALLTNTLGLWALPPGISVWSLVWPAAIIVVGLCHLTALNRFNLWGGIILLAGLYFLLLNLGVIGRLSPSLLLPIVLILAGLAIFVSGAGQKNSVPVQDGGGEGFIVSEAVFSRDERIIAGSVFTGARIHAAFGFSKLDLTGFESCAEPCFLAMDVAFGGCELYVPKDAKVLANGLNCAFGSAQFRGIAPSAPRYTLQISGTAAFGQVEIVYPAQISC